ncbi:carbon starvation protein A [Virgibacillus halodenitrificans]|uniref:Carbon starvation protein A n=1 Tax=Virgibacillus halodenitrificans TaxID=1482 RepID=A0AAC9NLC0_VIRHA|nr:carbon starvation protein A [Virgibacillus halodenitrificans]APC48820.1 carbon starvation protein A [Virgibacillus halodenitrificans]MBD1224305.1 carbon starvation protein A [Virgibacillus halodenitrificans]MCJ0931404.1 carbon starvation protein A [Virgibacillus halodenitrificans]MYL47338.1 carbon starvation protein A [Virgibacillus halodenitrificans]MYL57432.1 carbon starvation protein A [Virgibacillus halodenitrificans]
MSGILVALLGIVVLSLGYRYYSKFVAEKIFRLDPNYVTPAHRYKDGVDFVPTNKFVLWGHHFTSVAGAAPILGPAIAVYWGWLPAFLWVILGTVFAAGVHDFGTLVLSVRNKGQSVGTLAHRLVGQRAKILFLFIILILVLMVNAVFAWVISNLFISYPASVLPVFIQIPLAIWIGHAVYKRNKKMLVPSLFALAAMYLAAILASKVGFLQIDLVQYMGGEDGSGLFGLGAVSTAFLIWIVILMIYVYIASTLPVWKLLQPRDFINSHQLVVGLGILYLGLLFTNPEMTAPVTNANPDTPWLPLLFITIACGAISGFHGLVSSGTSSKQLDKETDARMVGYLGAVGEGVLALVSIIAVATFFANTDEFLATYSSFSAANGAGLGVFVEGAAGLAGGLAIPPDIATTIVSIIVVSFAATTLDTSVRLMRYIIAELGVEYKVPALTKTHVATTVAVVSSAALVLLPEGPKGFGSGGYQLWPLFGTANQLLAGISLMLIAVWLKRLGRNYAVVLIPMIFLMFMTLYAMFQQVLFEWSWFGSNSNTLLFVLGAIIFVFAIWIILTAFSVLSGKQETPLDDDTENYG